MSIVFAKLIGRENAVKFDELPRAECQRDAEEATGEGESAEPRCS